VWESLHWTNWAFHWDQDQGAPLAHLALLSREISHRWACHKLDHSIQFHDANILAKKSGHMEHHVRDMTEIEVHHDNINKEEGFFLSKSWRPLTWSLKEWKKALSKEKWLLLALTFLFRATRAASCPSTLLLHAFVVVAWSGTVLYWLLVGTDKGHHQSHFPIGKD